MKNGRPPIERTGQRGRPAKAKTSKKAVQAAVAKNRGRNLSNQKPRNQYTIEWNTEVDAPLEVDIDAR